MANDVIKVKRGQSENRPVLIQGEFGLDLDTEDLIIGGVDGSQIEIAGKKDLKILDNNSPLVGNYRTVKAPDKYNTWAVLVQIDEGKQICFYASGDSHKANGGKEVAGRKVVYKITENDGLNWSDEYTMLFNSTTDYTVFGAVYVSANDSIIVFVNENLMSGEETIGTDYVVMKSLDGGLTFFETFRLSNSTDSDIQTLGYPNVPVVMDNGELIASKQIKVADKWGIIFMISTDNGASWNESYRAVAPIFNTLSEIPWEIRVAYIGNSKLIAIGRNDLGNPYQLNSDDYGRTWTQFTTNIIDCKQNPLFPLYFDDDNTMVLYYNDRLSNTVKKRTVDTTFIYDNPTLWSDAEIIAYTSSQANKIDSGYITAIRLRSYRRETSLGMYTNNAIVGDEDTPKDTGIVVIYDSVDKPLSPPMNENIFINGGMNVWQYGTTFTPVDDTPTYVASQWIFNGKATNVSISSSSIYNKRTMQIDMTDTSKIYQPLLGIQSDIVTLTARLQKVLSGKVKLYLKYKVSSVYQETTLLAEPHEFSGLKTVSFTFKKPVHDLGSPIFVGIEMENGGLTQVYDMKFESGYNFTGFNIYDEHLELQKCLAYYEDFIGTLSFPPRGNLDLMYTFPYVKKRLAPTVTVNWDGNTNTARAWDGMDVGNTSLTVITYSNFVRFFGTKPVTTTPDYYDIDEIIIDGRIVE